MFWVLQADTEHGANEAHMLCMTEAPAAREDVLALWAWLRTHLAIGLLERWAAESGAQVCDIQMHGRLVHAAECRPDLHSFDEDPTCPLTDNQVMGELR